MAAGLGLTLGYLLLQNPAPVLQLTPELFNEQFPPDRLTYFMVVIGGSYVVCPMLFGRLLSARDVDSAVSGCRLAVAGLLGTAVLIVLMGVACRGIVPPGTTPDDVLPAALSLMPSGVSTALLLALLSAVLSSADSCLITLSTVCCHDLLRRDDVAVCRLVTLAAGVGGFLMATRGHGILDLLLMANDVYVCGAVAPLFCAMLLHGKRRVRPGAGVAAILCGGIGGLIAALSGTPETGYAGIVLSVICVLGGSIPHEDDRTAFSLKAS